MEDSIFISCKDCGWCVPIKPPDHMSMSVLYNCERKFYTEERYSFIAQARRCRSFAVPERAEEMRRIEAKSW